MSRTVKTIITVMTLITATGCGCGKKDNPLIADFNTVHGTPPFGSIKLEHYMPAFEEGIRRSREEIKAIANNPEAPTFENTVEAIERHGALLDRVATIFFALNSSETSDEMDSIANQIQPRLTELSNDIFLDPLLFERVRNVYDSRGMHGYDGEQTMLLEKMYRSFVRSGAGLNDEQKARYREITTELAGLSLRFGQNVMAETNAFSLNIPLADSARVGYMPPFVREAMAAEAAQRGQEGWTVTLDAPSFVPFLTYSRERDLKERMWKKYNSLCYRSGETDNSTNVGRIAGLRMELANLLGYETYADYVMEERMAESKSTVAGFLDELLVSTKDWAIDECQRIKEFALRTDGLSELMPWDFGYYSEKYKQEHYKLNEEAVKPYLRLENVENGIFILAEKLYGITFRQNRDIEVYHPDVKAFEVFDMDGSFLSVLYVDYFPRPGKRGGAWMTSFREMYTTAEGEEVRPLVTLCFNFTKPVGETPSLLTFNELETCLHEFGHALHGMFAKGRYASLTGTNVYHDFVELPSQIMENWATEKEFLDLWAVHYLTGEKMPDDIIGKIINAKNYLAAYGNVRQLSFGINDMAWHTIAEPVTEDPAGFERKALSGTQILPFVDGMCFSTSFRHVFAGGYAAGYYSYKWAEVLEADAFSLFLEKGIFDRATAESFRDNVLSRGGSEHPMTLYVRFRGHKPETKSLIKKIAGDRT